MRTIPLVDLRRIERPLDVGGHRAAARSLASVEHLDLQPTVEAALATLSCAITPIKRAGKSNSSAVELLREAVDLLDAAKSANKHKQ
jgi:hypothetical protein